MVVLYRRLLTAPLRIVNVAYFHTVHLIDTSTQILDAKLFDRTQNNLFTAPPGIWELNVSPDLRAGGHFL